VERPPYEQLLAEVGQMGYCTTARKYGVSDNAIRKWIRAYEAEREMGARVK
jgi:transposase-like protein